MTYLNEATTLRPAAGSGDEVLRSFRREQFGDTSAECSLLEMEIMAGLALRDAVRHIDPTQWK